MKITYNGPSIQIYIEADELSDGNAIIPLANGYTYERIFINHVENIQLKQYMIIQRGDDITFPVVNSKSPSVLAVFIPDVHQRADIRFTIEKFGRIPDDRYFYKAFEPILVTGDDGNEYKVIPSDQFK